MWNSWSLSCLAVMLSSLPIAAAADGPKKIVTIEGVTEYRLENGLQILLYPDLSQPTVTVNMTVFCGSRHEGYGEAGMAHLLEHMLFKGTPTHPEIPKVLQERGARFNGTTWVDRTNYYETLKATDENLEFAIRLEADRMVNSTIKGEDLASEMTVVRNEFERGENSPSRILRQKMASASYEWHNYGKSTIGNRSDIERVPLPKLRAFYRRFYQPDNTMVVVAGKFEPEKALGYLQKYFGSIPKPGRQIDRTYTEEPAQDGERSVTLRRVGDVGLVGASYHVPAGSHPEFAAVDVLGTILATEPAGRLYKALIETRKASSMYGGAFAWREPGLMFMLAEVPDEKTLEDVRDTMLEEIEKIGAEGVTKEEVERVQQQLLKQRELSLSDTSRIAVELSDWGAQGDWRLFFLYRDRIEKVTPQDVQKAAAKYLQRNNRTVGLFIPSEKSERVTIPLVTDIASMVKDYKGRETLEAGEQFDPSPENIEARTERFELPSGLKVALLPKKTRGQSVHLSLSLRYGTGEALKGQQAASNLLPQLMLRGTKQLNHQQLQDALDKNRTNLRGSGGVPGLASFSLQTKRAYLGEALKLLKQVLREPALPAAELEVIRRQQLADLESSLNDPMSLGPRRVRRLLAPYPQGHVRYAPTVAEEVELYQTVKLDDIKALYADFLSGQHGEIALVGDFDPKEVTQTLKTIFSGWKTAQPYSRTPQKAFTGVKGQQHQILTPDKANAVYYAALSLAMNDQDTAYPALVIGDFILGGGSLSSRLGDRVRQKEGLSYGVGSGFRASPIDDYSQLTLYAISNPENSPKVVKVIREEIDLFLKKGISAEELARAKSGYLERQVVQRTNDGQLASMLTSTSFLGRSMKHYAELEKKIQGLTVEQVQNAAKKYFDPDRLILVTAGDFEKKK